MNKILSLIILIIFSFIYISCKTGDKGKREAEKVLVGAIRWDAWTGGDVTRQVERTLGPKKYHVRLPWFAEVIDDSTVRIDGSPQEIMDSEIGFAANAGLDYWAFLVYPESSSMSQGLRRYLTSSLRQRLNFCIILHGTFAVDDEQWPKERDRVVSLLEEAGYQTVLGGRPLVYAFQMKYRGSFPVERFADFRRAAQSRGIDPYCVFMGWNPANDFKTASPLGFEAVSAYACGSADSTYAQLCKKVETNYWQAAATAKVPYVPLVTTGWDKNPRKDNPVSWEKGHGYHQQDVFPAMASPEEISSHLGRALTFVGEHPDICVANTVILYAWNENDEGGWLAPTWTPDGQPNTDRLKAVGKILTKKPGLTEHITTMRAHKKSDVR